MSEMYSPSATGAFLPWRFAESGSTDQRIIPTGIISLKDSERRRDELRAVGMPSDLIENYWPATDFRNKGIVTLGKYADIDFYQKLYGRQPRPAIIGNALSHRKLCEKLCETRLPLLLVFEDDVVPVRGDTFDILGRLLPHLYSRANSGAAFILHLGIKLKQIPSANNILGEPRSGIFGRWRIRDAGNAPPIWRAHAYIISRTAAERLILSEAKIKTISDDFQMRQRLGYFDNILYVEPGLFCQDTRQPSTVQEHAMAADSDNPRDVDRLGLRNHLRRLWAQKIQI